MVQTNKILTVSYGTFSCTLEGFDESFETMKAIAEYFRDLAADDRYFGAEPPTPDAEMLARIAEKEISRRVEARFENDGIVLRPSLVGMTDADTAEPDMTEEPQEVAPARETAEDLEAAGRQDDVFTPESGEDDSLDDSDDVAFDAELPEQVSVEAQDAELEMASAALTEDLDAADLDADDFDVEDVAEDDADEPVDVSVDDRAVAAARPSAVPESIAEKLARIRAVVSSSAAAPRPVAAPVAESDDTPEASDAAADTVATGENSIDESEEPLIGNIMSTLAAGRGEDVLAEDALVDTPEPESDPRAEAVEDVDAGDWTDARDAATADDDLAEDWDAQTDAAEDEAEDALTLADEDRAEEQADDLAENSAEADDDADVAGESIEEAVAPEEAGPVTPRRVAPRRPVRVVKVKRRAVEDAFAPVAAEAATRDTSLAPDDEADLMRELAEVEAQFTETSEDLSDDIAEVVEETERAVRVMARRERRDRFAEDEGDMSRLLAETDEQLQEPEGRSRRNAIAHLRAAVAATRADRKGERGEAGRDPRDAYRDDLAAAVRPRRGVADPAEDRPRVAPLKLVAEQRVDLPEDEMPAARDVAKAVRPRRVSMPVERDEDEEAGGFAAFAEDVGARGLPDLLEAAAAYMSFVEGREQFSRPQLMTKVRQVERGDTSREDRLRSFGQLLREGKIEKVDGGRFTASESIGFRPSKRAVG